jgi:hypothetical protein
MSFIANKFFILGVLALLVLIGIPLTIFFVKQQQELRSKAVASSNLTLENAPETVGVGEEFDVDVVVDPGENAISFVKFELSFDSDKLKPVKITANKEKFPIELDAANLASGSASMSVAIGASVSSAIQTPETVATVRFKALDSLGESPISFDRSGTQVLSVARTDEAGENVLSQTDEIAVTVVQDATQTPTPSTTGTPGGSPTPTTSLTNKPPVCTQLSVNPSARGTAPFSVSFTANGSDENGTLSKATFNFGDGTSQDITTSNQKSASVQASHTYTTNGTYNATVTFTDDNGAASASCAQAIQVGTTSGGTGDDDGTGGGDDTDLTGTPGVTGVVATPTSPLEPTPTLAPTGDVSTTTFGVIGGVLLVLIGGIVFFAL